MKRPACHCAYNARTGALSTTRRLHRQAAHKAYEREAVREPRPDRRPDRRPAIRARMERAS